MLRAQGLAEARLAMAQAEAEAIRRVADALPEGQAAMYLLGTKYLEALPQISQGAGSTIFLPAEATGVLGAVGGLRELLARAGAPIVPRPQQPQRPGQTPAYQPGQRPPTVRALVDEGDLPKPE